MAIELNSEVKELLAVLTKRLNISESAVIERCIRHLHKRLAALDQHREAHPNRGWGHTTEYSIWHGVMRRCFDPKCRAFPNYGGRGITVAPELQTFQGFLRIVGMRPGGKSLERIDNNGNYEPDNLRWATAIEQASNKRSSDLLTHKGRTQTLTAWSRELGMSQTGLWSRIYKKGWSVDQAMSTRLLFRNDLLTHKKRTQTLTEWAHELGMSRSCLWDRIYKKGWSVDRAISTPLFSKPHATLTPADVRVIRRSSEKHAVIAKHYPVTRQTISKIKSGYLWADVK